MQKITMTVQIEALEGGEVGLGVVTEAFTPRTMNPGAGMLWVGICTAINEYVRTVGYDDFDCLKAEGVRGAQQVGHA